MSSETDVELPPARRTTNVLRRVSAFRRLWFARAISHVGDGAAVIALVLYVKETERTGFAVGALLLAQALPRLLGPLTGALADRVDRRRLMIGCDLGQAALFTLIAVSKPPFAWLLVLVALTAILDTTFGPASNSAVPELVDSSDLLQANAWMGTTLNLQVAVGPFLGGLLVSTPGTRAGLLANALSFVASAALLMRLRPLPQKAMATATGILVASREGLAYAWRTPIVRALCPCSSAWPLPQSTTSRSSSSPGTRSMQARSGSEPLQRPSARAC